MSHIMPKIQDLLSDGTHFVERHGADHHVINALTGLPVIIAPANPSITPNKFVERSHPSGEIYWVYDNSVELVEVSSRSVYNPAIIDIICSRIVEGSSLSDVCKMPDMPTYATLCRWKRQEPWINEALEQARRDRAEALRDQALSEALYADEDTAVVQRLKVDTLKWAAGVDNEKYNPKTKIDATITAPTQIIVSTGIDRTPVEKDVTPAIEDKNDTES